MDQKLKILIAEDVKTIQSFYQRELSDDSFEKKIINNGSEALALYEEWNPDIVVLDIMMPIMNGYQVLKTIRNEYNDINTTVIMVTGVSEKSEVMACAKLGIQGYIVKPFNAQELKGIIMKCYEAHAKTLLKQNI